MQQKIYRYVNSFPKIALVIPAFNEAEVLSELFRRLMTLFDSHHHIIWQAVLIDDGSRDRTVEIIEAQCRQDRRFRLIALSRNFGFQNALSAGLAHCSDADAVITMDADLQDPPELIPEMIEAWSKGAGVVLAVRRSRSERGLRRLGFDLFHRFFGLLSDFPVEPNTGTFGLLGKPAVEAFNALPEKHRFFPGLRSWVGFNRVDVYYERQERAAGAPGQTLRRLVRYASDGVFSFSRLPLRLMTYAGVIVAFAGFAIGLFFVIRRLFGIEIAETGFTTLVTLVIFLGGIQLIGIGVLGEYLGRVYDEVKRRPNYIIKSRTGFE